MGYFQFIERRYISVTTVLVGTEISSMTPTKFCTTSSRMYVPVLTGAHFTEAMVQEESQDFLEEFERISMTSCSIFCRFFTTYVVVRSESAHHGDSSYTEDKHSRLKKGSKEHPWPFWGMLHFYFFGKTRIFA